jgi:hypothetical protein
MEIYTRQSIAQKFYSEGISYEKQKIRLLLYKVLEGSGKVIQLSLIDLPCLLDELQKGLQEALSHFGTILDFGLHQETTYCFFMGTGYAMIQQDNNKKYPKLCHTISWDDNGEFCHATFPEMLTWCRCCHDEGHTKYECKKAQASILCYACDKYGHK